jgi:peroxiredoxin
MPDVGAKVGPRKLTTIDGADVALPSPDATTHLQFRRFAGCPICNLHMRDVARRHQEISDAGVVEVVVFHSAAEELRRYQADLPFAVIADPDRKLYQEFGVESSLRHLGQPADFLIGADGTVRARKYGAHADDQWSVDEILRLATT